MKKVETIFIVLGLVFLTTTGAIAYTSSNNEKGEGDKKCKIKIVKIINGVKTEVDSTFDCNEKTTWLSSKLINDSLHKVIKTMMIDGDSNKFDFNFEFDEKKNNGIKTLKFKSDDGKEVEMKFDFETIEDGKLKINGEVLDLEGDEIHQHLEKLKKHIKVIHNESENIEIIMENDENNKESHSIKIIRVVDDNGNVSLKKNVDGKEIKIDEDDLDKKYKMMFINGNINGSENITVDVKVDAKNGKKTNHIVIIKKITTHENDDLTKEFAAIKNDLDKKELPINKLNFSPNPNDGRFNLSFKLDKKEPVQITIFDVQGKKVYTEEIKDFNGKYAKNIDISNNGEGIYLLQIIQAKKASTSKIIIK